MRVIIASVLSHLVVRPRRFWKIKEKKMKKKLNNDLAIVASQYLEGRFMTEAAWITGEHHIGQRGTVCGRDDKEAE